MQNDNAIKPFMKSNPVTLLSEQEFETNLIKFGSFLHLINNKNINPTFVFINLIKDDKLQELFMKITGCNSLMEMLQKILIIHPNLIKSKMIKVQCTKIIKNKKRKQELKNANRNSKINL
jgi:hypothetical protein